VRELDSKKRVLVIDARMLTPDVDAGSLRMYHLLRLLRDLSYRVTFAADFPSSWPPHTSRLEEDTNCLRELGIDVPSGQSSVEDHIKSDGELYDMVIISREPVATRHIASVRKYCPQAIVLFDTVDLHHLRQYRMAKATGNVQVLKQALQTKRRELAIVQQADYTLVVSPDEKVLLEKSCPKVQAYVIPIVCRLYGSAKPFSERAGIVFVGSFQHSPNLDAIDYFVSEIYPLIKKKIGGLKLFVVGSSPLDSIKRLSSSDIVVTGYVPDLASYFDNCRLSIAPLRFGAGAKGKVLTSMSYGVPVVASSIAAEGMYLTDGKDVLVADGPSDFCDAVVTLYQNETLWTSISESGLETISRHFSFAAVRAALVELLEEIGG
jgi:glycosyltransferase involved in cell wall biosynthesis